MENNIILYSNGNGTVSVNETYQNESFWLSQKAIAQLFDCSTDNVSLHLKNIFNSGELDANSVTEEFSATASDGKKYKTKFYNLDAIIAVGYRVNSKQATQFIIWATQTFVQRRLRLRCAKSKALPCKTNNQSSLSVFILALLIFIVAFACFV